MSFGGRVQHDALVSQALDREPTVPQLYSPQGELSGGANRTSRGARLSTESQQNLFEWWWGFLNRLDSVVFSRTLGDSRQGRMHGVNPREPVRPREPLAVTPRGVGCLSGELYGLSAREEQYLSDRLGFF